MTDEDTIHTPMGDKKITPLNKPRPFNVKEFKKALKEVQDVLHEPEGELEQFIARLGAEVSRYDRCVLERDLLEFAEVVKDALDDLEFNTNIRLIELTERVHDLEINNGRGR